MTLTFEVFFEGYGIVLVLSIRREDIINARHHPRGYVTQLCLAPTHLQSNIVIRVNFNHITKIII